MYLGDTIINCDKGVTEDNFVWQVGPMVSLLCTSDVCIWRWLT